VLWPNGADFRPRPLLERKAALHRTLSVNRRIRYARHLNDDCTPLWKMVVDLELEGIVAKDGRSTYQAGRFIGHGMIARTADSAALGMCSHGSFL
jgi:ATP-dependent DNA ligase